MTAGNMKMPRISGPNESERMAAWLWERPPSRLWPWTTSLSPSLSSPHSGRPCSYWYRYITQSLFQHVTKEFHRSSTVYVTSAQSHPCAIKQITFTSTRWLSYAAAGCPNMARTQNIRPAAPTQYRSSLHELFAFLCREWMQMNNCTKKAMLSLNPEEKATFGFVTSLHSNLQPHFCWHAGCTTNMMCASFSFFILLLLLFHKSHQTQLHALLFSLFASNPIYLTFSPAFQHGCHWLGLMPTKTCTEKTSKTC